MLDHCSVYAAIAADENSLKPPSAKAGNLAPTTESDSSTIDFDTSRGLLQQRYEYEYEIVLHGKTVIGTRTEYLALGAWHLVSSLST